MDKHVIKKYGNRKYYDTNISKYINLPDILDSVKAGNKVVVVTHVTGEDVTTEVLLKALATYGKADINTILELIKGGTHE